MSGRAGATSRLGARVCRGCKDRVAVFYPIEFQTLRKSVRRAFFRTSFDRGPGNVRFFVGSRSLPEVGLAKLLGNNVRWCCAPTICGFSPAEWIGFSPWPRPPDEFGRDRRNLSPHRRVGLRRFNLYRLTR